MTWKIVKVQTLKFKGASQIRSWMFAATRQFSIDSTLWLYNQRGNGLGDFGHVLSHSKQHSRLVYLIRLSTYFTAAKRTAVRFASKLSKDYKHPSNSMKALFMLVLLYKMTT